MSQNIKEELNLIKYLFGYEKGKVISEQKNIISEQTQLQKNAIACGWKIRSSEGNSYADVTGYEKSKFECPKGSGNIPSNKITKNIVTVDDIENTKSQKNNNQVQKPKVGGEKSQSNDNQIEKPPSKSSTETNPDNSSIETTPDNSSTETNPDNSSIENTTETNQEYIVKKGDTLSKIGKQFGVDWREIATLNNIKNVNLIYTNQKLKLPVTK
jgi:LysM repeat protein